jgi:uncharacterized RDD family membrane protein YckC
MTQPPALPPEGWYPNPDNTEQQRWWDGHQWTEHVAVGAPMAPGYQAPGYRAPGYQAPGYQAPGYQAPGYQPYAPQGGYPAYQPGYAPYPMAAPRGVLPDGAQVAGWWWRVLARIIDGFVVTLPTLLLGAPLIKHVYDQIRDYVNAADAANRAGVPIPHFNSGSITRDALLLGLIGGLVQIAYELILLKICAATLGKLACGLRIRAWDVRGPLAWGTIGKRVLAFQVATSVPQVGGIYYLLDVLWPLWDGRKQALHDKVAGTAVVKRYDAELAPQTYGGATGFGTYPPL